MSAAELTLYNLIRSEFKLSDEKAMEFIQSIEKLQGRETKKVSEEYKSIFKEDFYRMDLKLEELRCEIKDVKNDLLKWCMGGFITMVLMILGLFATILLK